MSKKKFMVFFIFGIFNFMLCASAMATSYYVSNSGSDKASGTSESNAWKTISKVNSFARSPGFKSGDVIKFNRDDIWSSDKPLGDSVNWGSIAITIEDYGTGKKPRFNANTFQPVNISGNDTLTLVMKNLDLSGMDGAGTYVASFTSLKNLTLDGIYMDGQKGASSYPRTTGMLIGAIIGDLEVKNCTVINFIHPNGRSVWGTSDAHAIYTSFAVSGGKTRGSYSIHHNVFGNVQADCIQEKGIAAPVQKIYNNEFYKYGENAIDFKNCANIEVYNNDFHADLGTKPGGTGGGISDVIAHYHTSNYGPHCHDITIRDNLFRDSDYGAIAFNDNGKNITITRNHFDNMSAGVFINNFTDVAITNNVFSMTNTKGLMEDAHKCAIELGVSNSNTFRNVLVQYNSIYGANDTRYGIRTRVSTGWDNINIKNNLIYMVRNNSDAYPLRVEDSPNPISFYKNTLINSNHSNRVYIDGSIYDKNEQTQWRNNYDAQGLFAASPLFEKDPNSGDLTLSSSSPAIGTGTTMKTPYASYSGSSSSSTSLEAPILEVVSTQQ